MPLRSSTFPVESSLRMLKGWHSCRMVRDGVRLGGCEDDVALAVSTDDRLGAADGAQEGGFDGGRLEADHEHREGKCRHMALFCHRLRGTLASKET